MAQADYRTAHLLSIPSFTLASVRPSELQPGERPPSPQSPHFWSGFKPNEQPRFLRIKKPFEERASRPYLKQ